MFDRLDGPERESLRDLRRDPNFYGILRLRAPSKALGAKTVDRDSALLFFSLSEPAPLPGYVRDALGAQAGPALARLVADHVLEVELEEGYASGIEALQSLEPGAMDIAKGRLAALACEAVRFASEFPSESPAKLASLIYGYNRLPLTPRWQQSLPDAAAHARYLGLQRGGSATSVLERAWPSRTTSPHWIFWSGRGTGAVTASTTGTYKLYVSPTPEALYGGGFSEIAATLGATRAKSFKVGAGVAGLLRPDKIVAYFGDFESLAEAGQRIGQRLAGMPVHGVPLTAEAAGDGLVSWGLDPPLDFSRPRTAESWRAWVAQRLAAFIISARATNRDTWRHAIARLQLEGVDPETWSPNADVFRES
jgi:hypothetical protein